MTAILNHQPNNMEAPVEQSTGVDPCAAALAKLNSITLNQADITERQQFAKEAQYVAGKLALKGQITVFFAGPNTGKTLLSLRLLADSHHQGLLDQEVYHINLDDDYLGATTKAALGLSSGFKVITSETFTKPLENFQELIKLLVESGAASKTIFILDTIKKFADVMDKKNMSAFITECRKLTSAGGSIIALAHTNKIKDDESRVIPGGTSDLLDDCDCAYVLSISHEEKTDEGLRRFVTFEQRKSRGPTAREALYSYVLHDSGDYSQLFKSVRNESPEEIQKAQQLAAIHQAQQQDAELIGLIKTVLNQGESTRSKIENQLQTNSAYGRRAVQRCLNNWNIPQADGGLWKTRPGDNNSTLYSLY